MVLLNVVSTRNVLILCNTFSLNLNIENVDLESGAFGIGYKCKFTNNNSTSILGDDNEMLRRLFLLMGVVTMPRINSSEVFSEQKFPSSLLCNILHSGAHGRNCIWKQHSHRAHTTTQCLRTALSRIKSLRKFAWKWIWLVPLRNAA